MKFRAAFIALAVASLATVATAQSGLNAMMGKKIPAFKMTDLKGKSISNTSLKGKVYLLDFWASWCGPCKAASPTVQAMNAKYKGKGFVAIGANTSDGDKSKQIATAYQKEHKYTYPFTYNNDAFAQKLGVRGLPAFILVDKTGTIKKIWTGFKAKDGEPGADSPKTATPAKIEAAIKALI